MYKQQEHIFLFLQSKKYGILFLFLILFLYAKSISFDYNLDDQLVFQNMPTTRDVWQGIKEIFTSRFAFVDYRPVSISTFYFEYLLFGKFIVGVSHGVNVFLYILLCVSGILLLRKLYILLDNKEIFFAALLFLCHPIHASVVSNIKNRDNILSMLFSTYSILLFIYIIRNNKFKNLPMFLLLFTCAIWCKQDAVFMVIFLPVLYYYEKHAMPLSKILFASGIVFAFLTLYYFALFFLIDHYVPVENNIYTLNSITENPYINDFNFLNRVKLVGITYWQYLKFLFMPWGYRFYYGTGYVNLDSIFSAQNIVGWILLMLTIASAIVYAIRRRSQGLVLLLFLSSLLYCLNLLVPVAGLFADRYAFIASLGFCLLVVMVVVRFLAIRDTYKTYILSAIALCYAFFSCSESRKWKDYDTLFERDMPYLKNTYEPNRIAASTYLDMAAVSQSENDRDRYLSKAMKYAQQGMIVYKGDNFLTHLLGTAYYMKGDLRPAQQYFVDALEMDEDDHNARMSLADICMERNDIATAAYHYDKVFSANSSDNQIAYKVVDAYCRIYDFQKADSINEIIGKRVSPKYIYLENKGYIYLYRKDTAQAYSYLEQAFANGLEDEILLQEIRAYKDRKP